MQSPLLKALTNQNLIAELTASDISTLSQKFWDLHTSPLAYVDGAATTLLTIQYNLCVGTILLFSKGRPELQILVDNLLQYKTM